MDSANQRLVEDIIDDVQECAHKYLETTKDIHKKMLEVSVNEGIELLESIRENFDTIENEEQLEIYRLNLLVPIQLVELLKLREENKETI